jgi:hypothetical protein
LAKPKDKDAINDQIGWYADPVYRKLKESKIEEFVMLIRSTVLLGLATFLGAAAPAQSTPTGEALIARRDLAAQESVAASTTEIVVLTRIQLILSVIGAAAVLTSLEMARRSLALTRSAVESQADTARHQLRAYFGIFDGEQLEPHPGSITLTSKFKNFGQTPALDMREWIEKWTVDSFGNSYPVKLSEESQWSYRGTIQPGATLSFRHSFNLDAEKREAARNKTASILSVAIYSYRDVFGESHVTAVSQVFGGPSLAIRVANIAFGPNHPEVARVLAIASVRPPATP